ncbi:MAG: PorT protein [Flavobacteriales bacterium MED-G22]|nr:MAG: PorT protein [Flavobacteriales bacterium MED-G22]|tara:strand:+ start:1495 stop:2184 length:690 start_codon:yes stop_codon:yes gene_type:complete
MVFHGFGQYPTLRERVINLPNFDKKVMHYGYFLGTNQYDFKFEYVPEYYTTMNYKDIAVESKSGFNVGLIGDLRINEFFNLRLEPGLYYSKRDLIYPEFSEFEKDGDLRREVKSTYIHLPLILKINVRRINNFRPFLLTGISTDFNLSSNAKNTDDNLSNVFRTVSQNLNYELGLGFDFYLVYFKFSPSIRGIFSFQNELMPDNDPNSPWTGKILNMFSRGFAINLTFE